MAQPTLKKFWCRFRVASTGEVVLAETKAEARKVFETKQGILPGNPYLLISTTPAKGVVYADPTR